jgi:hypothetical protein
MPVREWDGGSYDLARLGEPVVVDYVRLNIDATA